MHIANLSTYVSAVAVAATAVTATPRGVDQAPPEQADEEMNFHFGDDCDRLVWIAADRLVEAVTSGAPEDYDRFCAVESPAQCYDYADAVDALGDLIPADVEGLCKLELWPYQADVAPHWLRRIDGSADRRELARRY